MCRKMSRDSSDHHTVSLETFHSLVNHFAIKHTSFDKAYIWLIKLYLINLYSTTIFFHLYNTLVNMLKYTKMLI